jgi:hypothetical protein
MNTVKSLAIVALLLGGTSLAMAQGGLPTGNQPPVAGGAAGGPPGPGVIPHDASAGVQAAAPKTGASARTRIARHPTSRNRSMYMQANVHHGSKHTGTALSHQKFMNNQNTYR